MNRSIASVLFAPIMTLVLMSMMCTANAEHRMDGPLLQLWLQYGNKNDIEIFIPREDRSTYCTDAEVAVGGRIDGCDVAYFTWDCLNGATETYRPYNNYPITAEGMLLMFSKYHGDMGYDCGLLQNVNYRYGVSEVKLIESELFTAEYSWDRTDYADAERIEYGIYRFAVKTGDYTCDFLIVDEYPLDDGYPNRFSAVISESDSSYHEERDFNAERGDIGIMQVVNCEEWVSLRANPSTDSDRICKVDYYAFVQAYNRQGDFIFCNYEGLMGYIQSAYLERNEFCTIEEYWLEWETGE